MKYFVNNLLRHNGIIYHSGEKIELDESSAKYLLKSGTVSIIQGGEIPPVPEEFKKYSNLTANKQIENISKIVDKETLEKLLPLSKAKAKAVIERKLKESAKTGEE